MKSFISQNEEIDLYTQVKAGFLLQGTSLNRWCIEHNVLRQNAAHALKGVWNGDKSKELRKIIIEAAGLTCAEVEQ
jgi:hypothetical protein